MVRKRDQIIYKLPDNMQVSSIKEEQRQQLMKEIQALHQATMAAAASAQLKQQQQQQQQQGGSDIKPIAPKNEPPSLDTPPQPTAAEADAIKETARKLREELEQQQKQQQQQQSYTYDSNPSSPHDSSKTTRRYNKTGKYSKKKSQQQMQQQLHQQFSQQLQQLPFQQQQQLTQQQLLALQQSLQGNTVSNINTMMLNNSASNMPLTASTSSTPQTPLFPQQQQFDSSKSTPAPTPPPITPANLKMQNALQPQPDTILAKRLPDEENQHREVKKR